jgi:hypothetical protein
VTDKSVSGRAPEEERPFECYWDATDCEARVYRIDDGERHWYVAKSYVAALKEHYDMLGPGCDEDVDADSITISIIPAGEKLTRNETCGDDNEIFPPTFELKREPDRDPSVTATAADWAAHYLKSAPVQIMSSVF